MFVLCYFCRKNNYFDFHLQNKVPKMSSDSEDDCYGNIAQKLQSMKNQYSEDKIETTNILLENLEAKTANSFRKNDDLKLTPDANTTEVCDVSINSVEDEEYTLDAIIAKNSKKRQTRSSKRASDVCIDNIIPNKVSRTRKCERNASNLETTENPNDSIQASDLDASVPNDSTRTPKRGRGRGRARGTRQAARGRQPTQSTSSLNESTANTFSPRSRNKTPRRNRGRRRFDTENPLMYDLIAALAASSAMLNNLPTHTPRPTSNNANIPTYSVGNTDEYPDQCDDQPLFNTNKRKSDVVVVEDNDADLENEELSVKVYWQSSEFVRFNIRRFQKLAQIFDHFAEREKVSHDKLFFTYNDKILKRDDTPDSINYNIAKFIDGGKVHQSVSNIIKNDTNEGGIKLKFQCQNVKKPFITYIQPNDTLLTTMMKCAEHLEKPLDKLRFHFDGDLITGKDTARDLELEGGECIDVKIIS